MIEKLLENWLDSASERSYQSVFVQMLSARGYRVVHSTRHTALEFGKDILAVDPDGVGCAYQLKGTPGGKLGLSEFRSEIQPQLVQLMTQSVVFPGFPEGAHKAFLVNNGYYQEEVHRAVDDLNRNPAYPSKVSLIARGDLYEWCKDLGTTLWPSELEDTKALLELFLADPKDLLPNEKLASLLDQVLGLRIYDGGEIKQAEFERRVSSAALLTGIATAPFAEAGNHFAVISAWAIFIMSLIASAEKNGRKLSAGSIQPLGLAEKTIADSLALLLEEVRENPDLLQGNPMAEPEIRGWRCTIVGGLLACLAFIDASTGCLSTEQREWLSSWLEKPSTQFFIWGEAALPPLLTRNYWLLAQGKAEIAAQEIRGLAASLIMHNQPRSTTALADPYCSWSAVLSELAGFPRTEGSDSLGEGNFAGSTYLAEALLHSLVRMDQKEACQVLWPSFTKLNHHSCVQDFPWQYCTLKMSSGVNQTRIYPSTYEWKELQREATSSSASTIPYELIARPWLVVLWWQIAPYRFSAASNCWFLDLMNWNPSRAED